MPSDKADKKQDLPRWLRIALVGTFVILAIQTAVFLALRQTAAPDSAPREEMETLYQVTMTVASTEVVGHPPEKMLTPTPGIGSSRLSEKDGMMMVYVPEGEFLMGAGGDDKNAKPDEKPQRLVELDAFWIDRTEVTNRMYAQFLNEMGNQMEEGSTWLDAEDKDVQIIREPGSKWRPRADYLEYPSGPGLNTSDFPAVEVTWYGAQAYCVWAGRRLPTEAEWEKAARGTDGRTYPWGNTGEGCYAEVSGCRAIITGFGSGLMVGQWPEGASPYGALDMAGSVWEWTADWYEADYYASGPEENPQGAERGKFKSMRGSSWEYPLAPITVRSKLDPRLSDAGLGFRCVMDTAAQ